MLKILARSYNIRRSTKNGFLQCAVFLRHVVGIPNVRGNSFLCFDISRLIISIDAHLLVHDEGAERQFCLPSYIKVSPTLVKNALLCLNYTLCKVFIFSFSIPKPTEKLLVDLLQRV